MQFADLTVAEEGSDEEYGQDNSKPDKEEYFNNKYPDCVAGTIIRLCIYFFVILQLPKYYKGTIVS